MTNILEAEIGISTLIAASSEKEIIAKGLDLTKAVQTLFCHFRPVSGFDYSIRIFSAHPFDESAPLSRPMDSQELSGQLFLLTESGAARYAPNNDFTKKKGWEVRTFILDGKQATVVLASWV